ncbi:MAG: hypothetical protein KDD45_12865, partial [Bdellovibrionales bacterium]|nr:hypothetical protein [Bdellovibrionales bacterium]
HDHKIYKQNWENELHKKNNQKRLVLLNVVRIARYTLEEIITKEVKLKKCWLAVESIGVFDTAQKRLSSSSCCIIQIFNKY